MRLILQYCRTCSSLVFIEIIGIVRETDWSHTGMRVETDGSLELQQTDVIIQIVSFFVLRVDFDLIKYNILQEWNPSLLDLADSSPEVLSFISHQPVVITEIDLEIVRSLSKIAMKVGCASKYSDPSQQ